MIKIRNISKNFGGIKALNKCGFEIKKRKINALIGPNGSGKTTLFNLICGLMKRNEGEIFLDKEQISVLKDFEISQRGISRTFQDVRLFKNLTIKDHLEIALMQEDEKLIKSFFWKGENYDEKIKETLGLVGLEKSVNTLASNLSYGQRKLLDLAIAIIKPHSVLLLDEPVTGINPELRGKIKNILKKLNKNGETILIIEHDMNFILDLADYVFVLNEGKVIAKGKPKQIQNNKKVLEAYLGD